jgi:origin recognition complex subunit 3
MLFTALEAPHTYLQCECCKENIMGPQMEDSCVLYKLYQECGKLINLQDWYDAFRSIVDAEGERSSTELQYPEFI